MAGMEDYPDDWDQRRKTVYKRDDYTCQWCGSKGGPYGHVELHADHRVPRSQGGSDRLDNLQTLCRSCHDKKTQAETGTGFSDDTAQPQGPEGLIPGPELPDEDGTRFIEPDRVEQARKTNKLPSRPPAPDSYGTRAKNARLYPIAGAIGAIVAGIFGVLYVYLNGLLTTEGMVTVVDTYQIRNWRWYISIGVAVAILGGSRVITDEPEFPSCPVCGNPLYETTSKGIWYCEHEDAQYKRGEGGTFETEFRGRAFSAIIKPKPSLLKRVAYTGGAILVTDIIAQVIFIILFFAIVYL